MATINKRNKTWYIVFFRKVGEKSERKWYSLKTTRKDVAEKQKILLTEKHKQGHIEPFAPGFRLDGNKSEGKIWLDNGIEMFLNDSTHIGEQTRIAYKTILNCFSQRLDIGWMLVAEIKQEIIRDYLMRDNISDHTRAKEKRHLNRFFNYLMEKKIIKVNPIKGLKLPKPKESTGSKMLQPEELTRLFEAYDKVYKNRQKKINHRNFHNQGWFKPAIITAYNAGLRRKELINLKWSDFLEDFQYMHIHDAKGGKERIVVVRKKLREVLKTWKKQNPDAKPTDFVFSNQFGRPLTGDHIYRTFKRYCKLAGIPDTRHIHGLRHSFVTQSLKGRIPLNAVQRSAGHSNINVTKGYEHLVPEDIKKYYDELDSE